VIQKVWLPWGLYPLNRASMLDQDLSRLPCVLKLGKLDQHIGLKVQLKKSAYLGSGHEYTFGTELGDIFVIQNSTINPLQIGQSVGLVLDASGVSVVEG